MAGRPVWHRQRIASRASVVVPGPLDAAARARARALHLSLEPPSLQQLLVHASGIAAVAVVTLTHDWTALGHFFATVRAPALTGCLAALTIVMGSAGSAPCAGPPSEGHPARPWRGAEAASAPG